MKLLLAGHGESAANVDGVLSSYPGDGVALTELGRMHAEQLFLKLPRLLSVIYSSLLEGAIKTAEIALGKDAGDAMRVRQTRDGKCAIMNGQHAKRLRLHPHQPKLQR